MPDTAASIPVSESPPPTGDDPASLIQEAVDEVLRLAATWPGWEGAPRLGDGNVWTPNKALRRVTDHLIDHLAELEARLAGLETIPDSWLGRAVTTDGDWARFTEVELNEARGRLTRLAQAWTARLATLTDEVLDQPRGEAWTLREVAVHVAGVSYYARQVGDLGAGATASAADAAHIFWEWDRLARAGDVEGLLSLYLPDATLESPLVPGLLGQTSGLLRGQEEIRGFLDLGTSRRPNQLVRRHRIPHFQFDGRTLIWEYPREASAGDQLDLVEVMELQGPAIARHRIYWGWVGAALLAGGTPPGGAGPTGRPPAG